MRSWMELRAISARAESPSPRAPFGAGTAIFFVQEQRFFLLWSLCWVNREDEGEKGNGFGNNPIEPIEAIKTECVLSERCLGACWQ